MRKEWPIVLILVVYLLVGALYAIYTPVWQAPDEPAHYNYVRQMADGRLPVIEAGDYDQEYQGEVIASKFDPQYSIEPFAYEDWQPPFYYLLQLPAFLLADGALVPMRTLSVVLGAGVVIFAYLVAREVWPGESMSDRAQALTATVFVAFLPQHVAMMSAVNNDSLAELIVGAVLWLLMIQVRPHQGPAHQGDEKRAFRKSRRLWGVTGLILGLGFLTKASVYVVAPVVGLTILWLYWGQWRRMAQSILWAGLPALLLALLWWGRNIYVYEALDPLATAAHDAVVVGQPRTGEWLATYGAAGVAARFLGTTFNSFWGQFGWMAAPMPRWVYAPLLLFSLTALTGLLWLAVHPQGRGETQVASLKADSSTKNGKRRQAKDGTWRPRAQTVIMAGTFLLSLLGYLGYNIAFVQHQGRYLFPALIPIGVGVAAGLSVLLKPVWRRWSLTAYLLPFGLGVALVGLDLLALFRFIVPYLSWR